jgi:hypothetical protein
MTFFPLFNIIFLILIYRVHRPIFWIIGILEVVLYISWVLYIDANFKLQSNIFLYYLALTGAGLILGVAGFFIAISINQKHLYDDIEKLKKEHE